MDEELSFTELLRQLQRNDARASAMSDRFLPKEGPPIARLLMGVPMRINMLTRQNAVRRNPGSSAALEDANRLAATINPVPELFANKKLEEDLKFRAFLERLIPGGR